MLFRSVTLTPDLAENLGVDRSLKGVVVTQVEPGGPAADAGLRRGDVILEVNRQPVKDADAYKKALKAGGKGTNECHKLLSDTAWP